MKDLVALVLAGGEGKRVWPLTTNKVLFPFFGKPLIEYSVNSVLPRVVSKLVIVTSKENNESLHALTYPVPHVFVVQSDSHGMAGAILASEKETRGSSILIINGDDVNDPGMYDGVLRQAEDKKVFGIIPGWYTEMYRNLGYLVFKNKQIIKIIEKPGEGNEPSKYVYMVGYYLNDSSSLLDDLKKIKSDRDDVHELALSSLMKTNRFEMYKHTGGFASLKYPWDVLDVMNELFKRIKSYRGKNLTIKSCVEIEGVVHIGDNVKIFENSKIVGPTYIGDNTIIGNNNMIRASHIGANCVTGFNTDITRSYIGNDCWFHSNYIGDSVLEENVSMGAGATLANLRLDDDEIYSVVKGDRMNTKRTKLGAIIGKHVRIGVNASIMPGIKVGHNSFIGAGVVLDKDLPDNSYCTLHSNYTITSNQRYGIGKNREKYKEKL